MAPSALQQRPQQVVVAFDAYRDGDAELVDFERCRYLFIRCGIPQHMMRTTTSRRPLSTWVHSRAPRLTSCSGPSTLFGRLRRATRARPPPRRRQRMRDRGHESSRARDIGRAPHKQRAMHAAPSGATPRRSTKTTPGASTTTAPAEIVLENAPRERRVARRAACVRHLPPALELRRRSLASRT